MTSYKVDRFFNRLKQDALAIYALMVAGKIFEHPDYVAIAPFAVDLNEKAAKYDAALKATANGGVELTRLKNIAKDEVKVSLNHVANALENNANGVESYIVLAGMAIKEAPVRALIGNERPKAPTNVVLQSIGGIGELEVKFTLPNKKHVAIVAVETKIPYTDEPFTNGRYLKGEKGTLRGFQNGMVEVRFISVGNDGLKSDPTPSFIVPVL